MASGKLGAVQFALIDSSKIVLVKNEFIFND
jgi:hypothetical protein